MPDTPDASLIRRYLDGESTAEESRLVEAAAEHPAVARLLANERLLRARLHQVLSADADQATPEHLRASVLAGLREDVPVLVEAGVSGEYGATAEEPFSIFTNPTRMNYFAVAAVLVIILGAVLVGVFGRPLFSSSVPEFTAIADVEQFIANEHMRCTGDPEVRRGKVKFTDLASAHAGLSKYFGQDVPVPDLSAFGFTFVGAGTCGVPPRRVRSGHLMYMDANNRMVSVFIEPDQKQFPLVPGRSHSGAGVGVEGASEIWTNGEGQLVFMLVVCRAEELRPLAEYIRHAMLLPR